MQVDTRNIRAWHLVDVYSQLLLFTWFKTKTFFKYFYWSNLFCFPYYPLKPWLAVLAFCCKGWDSQKRLCRCGRNSKHKHVKSKSAPTWFLTMKPLNSVKEFGSWQTLQRLWWDTTASFPRQWLLSFFVKPNFGYFFFPLRISGQSCPDCCLWGLFILAQNFFFSYPPSKRIIFFWHAPRQICCCVHFILNRWVCDGGWR